MSKLKEQSKVSRKQIEQKIIHQLMCSELWHHAQTIGITISQTVEWNTIPIIEAAWDQGKKICVPKSNPINHQLDFYSIDSFEEVEVAYYDLLEPITDITMQMEKEAIDLMIVPGIVFDTYGFRIGFGGGYYDRFLADYPNETCSLLSEDQLMDKLPAQLHDIPINYLITERGIQKRKIS